LGATAGLREFWRLAFASTVFIAFRRYRLLLNRGSARGGAFLPIKSWLLKPHTAPGGSSAQRAAFIGDQDKTADPPEKSRSLAADFLAESGGKQKLRIAG
jgi:hypothetical protein